MTSLLKIFPLSFTLALLLLFYNIPAIASSINHYEISVYTTIDKRHKYSKDSVLFIGSSSIKRWDTLEQDMSPRPIIQRGFNAAKLADINMIIERIVIPHKPKQIVLFAGVNDLAIAPVVTVDQVYELFIQFIQTIHDQLKDCTIYFIAISPAPTRWGIWNQAQQVNQKVEEYARQNSKVVFIETESAFLNKKMEPKIELFAEDGIHLNEKGYAIWTKLVSLELMKLLQNVN